jgi:hypothetical protein
MPTIDKGRLKRFLSKKVHLVSGKGEGANGTIDVCVVQATDWLVGRDGKSDSPSCVDPVIRGFAIRLNDAGAFSQWRDELKPFAARLANTNQGHALTRKRRFACADWAIREIAPLAIDACGKAPEFAAELRALPPIVDKATALAGRAVARQAERKLRADATATYAAYAYAAAVAAAAADAAVAAVATAAAVASADAKRPFWDASLAMLGRLCDMTAEKVST